MKLPDDLRGRLCHTTALIHKSSVHKELVTFGGIEDNESHPIAHTIIMDLCKFTSLMAIIYDLCAMITHAASQASGAWEVVGQRLPTPRMNGIELTN